jgi:hypothetical protein
MVRSMRAHGRRDGGHEGGGAKRLLVAVALLALSGCAIQQPPAPAPTSPPPATAPAPVPPSPPPPGSQVGTTASGGTITVNAPAVPDSAPSPEALAVLRTIPDPLGRPESSDAPDTAGVPVPSPTDPLGDRPGSHPPPAETAAPPPPARPASTDSSAAAAPGRNQPCWRVQVASAPEAERARRLADAAASQLPGPFVIEREGGYSKVRSRDCMSGEAANALRARAVAAGFDGAFRFVGKRP